MKIEFTRTPLRLYLPEGENSLFLYGKDSSGRYIEIRSRSFARLAIDFLTKTTVKIGRHNLTFCEKEKPND